MKIQTPEQLQTLKEIFDLARLAGIKYNAGKFEEALDHIYQALEKNPTHQQCLEIATLCYIKLNLPADALIMLDRLSKIDHREIPHIFIYSCSGYIYTELQLFPLAIDYHLKAYNLNPDDNEKKDNLAAVLALAAEKTLQDDEIDSATKHIKQSLALKKYNPGAISLKEKISLFRKINKDLTLLINNHANKSAKINITISINNRIKKNPEIEKYLLEKIINLNPEKIFCIRDFILAIPTVDEKTYRNIANIVFEKSTIKDFLTYLEKPNSADT